MEQNQKLTTRKIVFVALMAALTTVASGFRIKLPVSIAGTTAFHLGNIFCALSGILLGPWLGGLAAGMGSAIFDIFVDPTYMDEAWITFIMKGAYGVVSGLVAVAGRKEWKFSKNTVAAVAGAITYAVLYLGKSYFYGGMLKQGLTASAAWLVVIDKLPATIFNAVVAVIFAPILATAIQKALQKNHLTIE